MKIPLRNLIIEENIRPLDAQYVQELYEAGAVEHTRPVVVVESAAEGAQGFYRVLDGQHRVAAADLLGIEEIDCEIIPYESELNNLTVAIAANVRHGKRLTLAEKSDLCKKMHREYTLSTRQIAKILQISQSTAVNLINRGEKKKPELTEGEIASRLTRLLVSDFVRVSEFFEGRAEFFFANLENEIGENQEKYNAVEWMIANLDRWQ